MFSKISPWFLTTILLLGVPTVSASTNEDSLFVSAMGARSQAMGGTGVASTYDLSPAFNNPALLALVSPWTAAFSFRQPSPRVKGISLYTNGICPRKVYRWGFGVDVIWANHSRWPGQRRIRSTNTRVQFTMAMARRVYDELVVGVAFKPAGWQLYGENHSSFEADLGVAYPTRWRDIDIVAGAVVRDLLGAEVTRLDHDTALDVSALLGVAGRYFTKDSLWELSAGIDLEAIERDFVADPQGRFRIGGEAAWHRFEAYRLAGRFGHNGEEFTAGVGVDWRFLRLDWAKTLTEWETGQTVTLSVDPRGAMDFLSDLFGQTTPTVNWRDSIFVYRLEQFTHYESSADASFETAYSDTTRFDEARILYHNARVFADDAEQMAVADSGIARSEEIMDRWEFVADSLVRATHLGGLLEAERTFTDAKHRELLSQADTCFRNRDYVCALELIDMVLAQDSTHAEALSLRSDVEQGRNLEIVFSLVLADTAERENLLGRALEAYLHILELDTAHTNGQEGKGRVDTLLTTQRLVNSAMQDYKSGRVPSAIARFDSAAVLDPNLIGLQNLLSGFKANMAGSTSLDDIKGDPAIYALFEEGLAFNSTQQYQKAIEAFNKVLQKYPKSPAVIEERRQALLMLQ